MTLFVSIIHHRTTAPKIFTVYGSNMVLEFFHSRSKKYLFRRGTLLKHGHRRISPLAQSTGTKSSSELKTPPPSLCHTAFAVQDEYPHDFSTDAALLCQSAPLDKCFVQSIAHSAEPGCSIYRRGFSHCAPSLDGFFAQLTQISFLHSSRSKHFPITALFPPAFEEAALAFSSPLRAVPSEMFPVR